MINPAAYLDIQIGKLSTYEKTQACEWVLNDPRFKKGWGSNDKHHAYPGALLYHTAEVLELALTQASSTSIEVDQDVLICAAVFHDYMKLRDYFENGTPRPYKSKIYHVAGSYAEWVRASAEYDLDQEFIDAVGHCILSHHGRREWKACVEPQTVEAQILHNADLLSATYGRTMNPPLEGKELNVS